MVHHRMSSYGVYGMDVALGVYQRASLKTHSNTPRHRWKGSDTIENKSRGAFGVWR